MRIPAPAVGWYFNPLPPYGGRHSTLETRHDFTEFQSTPSVWRETISVIRAVTFIPFQSTPSVWRETEPRLNIILFDVISIHSLRMEGDVLGMGGHCIHWTFQSTPSVWRETYCHFFTHSIRQFQSTPSVWRETCVSGENANKNIISIHSLRMEGDNQI